jgi:thioester reductase-like protein
VRGDPADRIASLLKSPIWHRLRDRHGDTGFEKWFTSRVTAIAGDLAIRDGHLGMSQVELTKLGASYVIHAAASVKFDMELQDALHIDADATVDLYRTCASVFPDLELFIHVSTAYVQTTQVGPESLPASSARLAPLDNDSLEMRMAARDWPNTYAFAKTVGDARLVAASGFPRMPPVHILRPTCITAAQQHPALGWTDSTAATHAGVLAIATGVDIIPIDIVVNASIACVAAQSGSKIWNIISML